MTIKTELNGVVKLTASLLSACDLEELRATANLFSSEGDYYIDNPKDDNVTMTRTVTLRRPLTWEELNDAFAELCCPKEA